MAINSNTGLTIKEQETLDALVLAFNKFTSLDIQHPDERRDFTNGIHYLQGLLTVRIARREYPKGWPTYTK